VVVHAAERVVCAAPVGRPFSARIAWSVLAERAGAVPGWRLAREERARVTTYAARPFDLLAPRLVGRARALRLSAGPRLFERLAEHPRWARGARLEAPDGLDAWTCVYTTDDALDALVIDAAAIPDETAGDLVVRVVPAALWCFGAERGGAVWPDVAALDAYEAGDRGARPAAPD